MSRHFCAKNIFIVMKAGGLVEIVYENKNGQSVGQCKNTRFVSNSKDAPDYNPKDQDGEYIGYGKSQSGSGQCGLWPKDTWLLKETDDGGAVIYSIREGFKNENGDATSRITCGVRVTAKGKITGLMRKDTRLHPPSRTLHDGAAVGLKLMASPVGIILIGLEKLRNPSISCGNL